MKRRLSDLMKLFSLKVMLAIFAPALTQAQTGKANFAGPWALNAEKNTFP